MAPPVDTPVVPPVTPPAPGEDAYEENDTPQQAEFFDPTGGSLSTIRGLATSTDNDYYRFNLDSAGTFTAVLDSVPAEGEINIEIYDAGNNLLSFNYNSEESSTLFANVDFGQELWVYVYGTGGFHDNTYDLSWNFVPAQDVPALPPADPAPVDNNDAPDLVTDTSQVFQTIAGFGSNLAHYFDDATQTATEDRSIYGTEEFQQGYFDELGASIVRIDLLPTVLTNSQARFPTPEDLADPVSLDGTLDENIAKFNFDALGVGHLKPALDYAVATQGDDFRIIGAIWTPPIWLKTTGISPLNGQESEPRFVRGDNITGGTLDTDQAQTFKNYIVAWIKGYEREVGLQFDSLSLQNEPRFGDQSFNSTGYTPETYAELTRIGREAIEEHNAANPDDLITTRLLGFEDVGLGPVNRDAPEALDGFFNNITDYLEATDSDGVRTLDNLDIQGQHGFVTNGVELNGSRSSAIQWDKFEQYLEDQGAGDDEIWSTEWSGEQIQWLSRGADGQPLELQNGAFSTAVLIHDALTAGDVNAYLYWQATSRSELGDVFSLGAQNNFDTAKAASFRHFSQYIRPDAERIQVSSDDDSILASGYLNEDGSITYVIINRGGEADNSLTLSVPEAYGQENFDVFQTNQGQNYLSLPDILPSANGTLSFAVPGYSVTTLTTLPD